jgi:hypothetical protein
MCIPNKFGRSLSCLLPLGHEWWKKGRRQLPLWSKIRMKMNAEFMKTTLIGGFLIVLPVYVSLLLLAKAFQGLLAMVKPITAGKSRLPWSFARSWRLPRCVSSAD